MSILIKGMKMPKNCNECKFGTWSNFHQTVACKGYDYEPCFEDRSREYREKRADFCPFVEVPTPHGRLIDADKLLRDASRYVDLPPRYEPKFISILDVENAPTIIEAERTE